MVRVNYFFTIHTVFISIWEVRVVWNDIGTYVLVYQSAHNVLRAHAKAYRIYQS
jgi:hypothetical protein